ncbi:hypothetical protein [Noviherbaspirillum malthae]|uniref:hypothetical protein n=1 Tax=Noviherbaspirillum malthae TaxID=1260987 RepID=UPI00188EA4CE|nr:hypothetical protein [Noviherbaspirillum malthae]
MKSVIFGLGDSGAKLARRIKEATGMHAIALNTDQRSVENTNLDYWIAIGPKSCRGRAAGNPHLGLRAASESQSIWSRHLAEIDTLIMAVGLGGGAGTGAALAIGEYARQKDIKVYCGATLPFAFEGARRQYAFQAVEHLRNFGVKVITESHEEMMEKMGLADSDVHEVRDHTDKALLLKVLSAIE